MAELKTKPNDQKVDAFLRTIADEKKRQDCLTLLELMKQVTKSEPKMWGGSIIGFGHYHYRYASGHEGDTCLAGFSPRKQNITLYLTSGFAEREALLAKLGKFKTGKACLYVKKLDDIDLRTLRELVRQSVEHIRGQS